MSFERSGKQRWQAYQGTVDLQQLTIDGILDHRSDVLQPRFGSVQGSLLGPFKQQLAAASDCRQYDGGPKSHGQTDAS